MGVNSQSVISRLTFTLSYTDCFNFLNSNHTILVLWATFLMLWFSLVSFVNVYTTQLFFCWEAEIKPLYTTFPKADRLSQQPDSYSVPILMCTIHNYLYKICALCWHQLMLDALTEFSPLHLHATRFDSFKGCKFVKLPIMLHKIVYKICLFAFHLITSTC